MMTTIEIYRNALENLRNLATRQQELAQRYMRTSKGPEWRAKFLITKGKIEWLEKIIRLWEVK